MTREEFARGWILLVAQPWGRRYAEDTDISRVQSEFYLSRLGNVPATTWAAACERAASGSTWPSVDDLMGMMNATLPAASRHPGVESAWSMVAPCLRDEQRSVVWTEEMREAFGAALALVDDTTAARMAFKETYGTLLKQSTTQGILPKWSVSFGYNKDGRADAVREAVAQGRISQEQGVKLLPRDISLTESEKLLVGIMGETKRIG